MSRRSDRSKTAKEIKTIFKLCGCRKCWATPEDLINDPEMYYNGISVLGKKVLFLFTHRKCKSTLSVSAQLLDKYFTHLNEKLNKEAV